MLYKVKWKETSKKANRLQNFTIVADIEEAKLIQPGLQKHHFQINVNGR